MTPIANQGMTVTRSKADFRAMRELLGLTQAAVATALHVTTQSVITWENPKYFYGPTRDSWLWIEPLYWDTVNKAQDAVELAQQAKKAAEDDGRELQPIWLTYWRRQEDYITAHRHGNWRIANAVTRLTAQQLRLLNIPCTIMYAEVEP